MDWRKEWKALLAVLAGFLACFYLPVGQAGFDRALGEALGLVRWYAREHVVLCLAPAFFIAGAIGVFVSQAGVMKYLGAGANRVVAYGVASVAGTILAVCSCTVLPLFAGIYRRGAGLGPATAFLYSGPAINILAIILTARVLGPEIGIARAVGAVLFSVAIGLSMHLIFRKEELGRAAAPADMPEGAAARPLWQNAVFFALMIAILVFANWGAPAAGGTGAVQAFLAGIAQHKWHITSVLAAMLGVVLALWYGIEWWKILAVALPSALLALLLPMQGLLILLPFGAAIVGLSAVIATRHGEAGEWFACSWGFAKQILPLLLIGVMVAGFLLGRPGREGMIPGLYVRMLAGPTPEAFLDAAGCGSGLSSLVRAVWPLWTNFFAAVFGAFMYFATLTEVPILQGLLGAGMGRGPALALLLAGPALSLPNMLVIRSLMGTKKTMVFIALVVFMATLSGMIFGLLTE